MLAGFWKNVYERYGIPTYSDDKDLILTRWRGLYFLDIFKKNGKYGSIDEWFCAKELNDLAAYLYETKDYDGEDRGFNDYFTVLALPMVAKLFYEKGHPKSPMAPKDFCEMMESVTVGEVKDYLKECWERLENRKNGPGKETKRRIDRICNFMWLIEMLKKGYDEPFIRLMYRLVYQDEAKSLMYFSRGMACDGEAYLFLFLRNTMAKKIKANGKGKKS